MVNPNIARSGVIQVLSDKKIYFKLQALRRASFMTLNQRIFLQKLWNLMHSQITLTDMKNNFPHSSLYHQPSALAKQNKNVSEFWHEGEIYYQSFLLPRLPAHCALKCIN